MRREAPDGPLRFVPSAMTVLAICLGLTSIKYALEHRPTEAMALIAAAAILDALDGRAARMLNATSKMGEEIDSLADAINFGVAPAFIVWALLLEGTRVGWIVVLLYAVCIVLRLARYNALLDEDLPAYTKQYFVGMPAPAGAIGAIGPLAARMQWGDGWWTSWWFVSLYLILLSLLVVSRIPMRKIHTFAVPPRLVAPLLAAVAIVAAGAFVFPYLTILVIIVAYVCHIPFAVRSKAWLASHPEVWEDQPKQQRQARRAIRRAQPSRRGAAARRSARLRLRRPGGDG